jgi:hypothetical protein
VHNPIKSASIELEKLMIPFLCLHHCKYGAIFLILNSDIKSFMICSEIAVVLKIRCANHLNSFALKNVWQIHIIFEWLLFLLKIRSKNKMVNCGVLLTRTGTLINELFFQCLNQ